MNLEIESVFSSIINHDMNDIESLHNDILEIKSAKIKLLNQIKEAGLSVSDLVRRNGAKTHHRHSNVKYKIYNGNVSDYTIRTMRGNVSFAQIELLRKARIPSYVIESRATSTIALLHRIDRQKWISNGNNHQSEEYTKIWEMIDLYLN